MNQVEVITSAALRPSSDRPGDLYGWTCDNVLSPAWERFVVTGKAKAAIRRFIRTRQREQYVQLGRSLLDKAFHEEGFEVTEKGLEGVKANFKQAGSGKVKNPLVAKRGVVSVSYSFSF